jgi:hypothetical protein
MPPVRCRRVNVVPAWLTPRRAAVAAAAVVGLLYVAALPGPLRLDVDSANLLYIGGSLADGTGFHPPGSQSLPPGYPIAIAALDEAGLAGPVGFMLLGVVSLAVALAASWSALRLDLRLTRAELTVVAILTALSVYAIKYTLVPVTEMLFFAVSAVAVAAYARSRAGGSVAWLVAGAAITGVACAIRTAGVALGLAAVLAFPTARARAIAAVVAGIGGIAVVAVAPYYLDILVGSWRDEPFRSLWHEPYSLLHSSGAVAANVPTSSWQSSVFLPITVVAGAALLAVVVWALWSRRRVLGPVDGFAAATVVIILLFPTEHPRFFLPIVPYLVGYCVLAARKLPRLAFVCAAGFAALGLAGLAYSTFLSYTGDRFPERYAGGNLAVTYRTAWGSARPGDGDRVDERILWALRRYDPDPPSFP